MPMLSGPCLGASRLDVQGFPQKASYGRGLVRQQISSPLLSSAGSLNAGRCRQRIACEPLAFVAGSQVGMSVAAIEVAMPGVRVQLGQPLVQVVLRVVRLQFALFPQKQGAAMIPTSQSITQQRCDTKQASAEVASVQRSEAASVVTLVSSSATFAGSVPVAQASTC
ncbi:hypothetical protein AB1L30_05295 [Bremerella sp. JC817]|uniref:hypothetical protein n=1 Tax=Bremerella sp. JC817 TaxID=3231756 RepID=UPI003458B0F2